MTLAGGKGLLAIRKKERKRNFGLRHGAASLSDHTLLLNESASVLVGICPNVRKRNGKEMVKTFAQLQHAMILFCLLNQNKKRAKWTNIYRELQ